MQALGLLSSRYRDHDRSPRRTSREGCGDQRPSGFRNGNYVMPSTYQARESGIFLEQFRQRGKRRCHRTHSVVRRLNRFMVSSRP